ncbi:penicillin-binding transpeptidase domain-containing protein [Gracilibacillus kekensis]|uniref:serine-type D-Ala-D-Ala carboxypeptidase n=1 Tax=Gracilibacillus kekensis TaxID=1027249 RepID=A0A1M7N2C1_9BACI|nr:penicillin-binding transpeptidase domain-containing protein [Gracilibacillus kekensis]SHM97123.1 penicillin-binding protein [Gracilibacillus kekensis]
MRRAILILMAGLAIFLVACQEDEEQIMPEDRLQEYVDLWNEQDFENMYNMVENADKEEFDRYQKIYGDIEVTDLSVDFQIPETGEEKEEVDIEEIEQKTFPLQVNMETVAGPISFETDIEMVKTTEIVEEEEQIDWLVNWHQGLIFPELEDGGEVGMSTTAPSRGQIYDRNRRGLAVNESVYEFGVEPQLFTEGQEEEEKEAIAEVLNISIEDIDSAMSAGWVEPHLFVPLKVVPSLNGDLEEALASLAPLKYQTPTGRIYPLGEAAAHLVGYIAPITAEKLEEVDSEIYSESDMIGYRGLEELFEEELRGEKGVEIYVTKEEQDPITLAKKEVKNGDNINLTIDSSIQESIFHSFSGDAGVASAIDPTTGETLALVSSPSFDPNAFVYGLSGDQWTEWQKDPKNPLLNRFSATFAPGSVFKPITSAIGLENGSIDPNEGITINGLTWQKEGWGDYSVRRVSESSGPVDLKDALVRSDNIYFAQQALAMGEESFIKGLKQFGIGEEFPFTYPIEDSSISSDGSLSSEVLLADTSYGQGQIEMSALQLATSYSAFLNNGNLVQPTLLLDEEKGQSWKEGLLSEENANFIQDALRSVVTDGTGSGANVNGLSVSGKTGTAELKQTLEEKGAAENGWFVGYPEDNSILISMMVENIEDKSNGSGYVAEKVGSVLSEIK